MNAHTDTHQIKCPYSQNIHILTQQTHSHIHTIIHAHTYTHIHTPQTPHRYTQTHTRAHTHIHTHTNIPHTHTHIHPHSHESINAHILIIARTQVRTYNLTYKRTRNRNSVVSQALTVCYIYGS